VSSTSDGERRLLLVEDDDALAALLAEYLGQRGLSVSRVATGHEGVARILEEKPDLVVLDLMLPGLDGLDVCRRVRAEYEGAILMLTASQSEADHVAALEIGADDFVTKPIEPRVLLARIRTQLRRLEPAPREEARTVEVGPLHIDTAAREVRVDGREVPLTSMEYDVLLMLARGAGTVVQREDLYAQVMGASYDGLDRGMDVHVSRVRKKLQRSGFDTAQLRSVRGVGYLLVPR